MWSLLCVTEFLVVVPNKWFASVRCFIRFGRRCEINFCIPVSL